MTISPTAIARAESTLTDTCTITRPGASSFTAGTAAITTTTTTVYSGPCALPAPSSGSARRDGADDRIIEGRPINLPHGTTGIAVGDLVTVDRADVPPLRVDHVLSRTTSVLVRISCAALNDAPGVPT